jgi:hypothetical protein
LIGKTIRRRGKNSRPRGELDPKLPRRAARNDRRKPPFPPLEREAKRDCRGELNANSRATTRRNLVLSGFRAAADSLDGLLATALMVAPVSDVGVGGERLHASLASALTRACEPARSEGFPSSRLHSCATRGSQPTRNEPPSASSRPAEDYAKGHDGDKRQRVRRDAARESGGEAPDARSAVVPAAGCCIPNNGASNGSHCLNKMRSLQKRRRDRPRRPGG